MKFNGEKLNRVNIGTVVIPRYDSDGELASSLPMKVAAIPMGWHIDVVKTLPEPVAPKEFATKPGSNRLEKDESGRPFYVTNEDDPAFVTAEAIHTKRYNAWVFFEALRLDDRYSFTADKPSKLTVKSVAVWLDALIAELSEAGFGDGDLGIVIMELAKLGNVTGEAVEEARAIFLVKKPKGKAGNSQKE